MGFKGYQCNQQTKLCRLLIPLVHNKHILEFELVWGASALCVRQCSQSVVM